MQPILNNAARLSALRKAKAPKPGQGKGESYDMSDSGKSAGEMVEETVEAYKSGRERERKMFGKKGK